MRIENPWQKSSLILGRHNDDHDGDNDEGIDLKMYFEFGENQFTCIKLIKYWKIDYNMETI